MFFDLASGLAALSTCSRRQVGCVVCPPDLSAVVAIGYNGPARGLPNDSCRGGNGGGCGCVHAEANAVAKLMSPDRDLVLVTTCSPCEHCAGLILNCGRIGCVFYRDDYRLPAGLAVLGQSDVLIVRWADVIGVGHLPDPG